MQDIIKRLAERLYNKNEKLTIDQAITWVELLWEDFDSTRAKAGREYAGKEVTEQIVLRWIDHYGPKLHEFAEHNPKYRELFEKNKKLH
ncbi:YfhJ family protein [Aquibacillus saliphilus]|uniref:YfhJ family protein n=1 Tax=Aquibacillus saliphilus TaxID=1909422 RepID=UPI001CF06A01|nr:YfhJ family protein [Aquibacillus saliphilus]